jgi:hypothetical protein
MKRIYGKLKKINEIEELWRQLKKRRTWRI